MGGRGASSSGGDGLPSKFRAALGRKGKPRDIETVLKTANPQYHSNELAQINCQRCAWAYEMQRRGYKVQAQLSKGMRDDFALAGNPNGFKHVFDDAKWEQVKWYPEGTQSTLNLLRSPGGTATQRKYVRQNIEGKMTEWGEGSRGIVYVTWRGQKYGHAFSVENIGGKAYIVDAQPGRKIPLKQYIDRANVNSVNICRTDTLRKPNENLLKAVKPL